MKKTFLLFMSAFLLTVVVRAQGPKAVALNENFDAMGLPSGWTIIDTLSDGNTWEFVDYYPVSYSLDGSPFALVNSDAVGAVPMSEQLISPALNVSSYTTVFVEFDHYFRDFGGGGSERASVDVWNGTAWVTIYTTTSTAGAWGAPDHQYINASAYKNAAFKVRFRYYGANNDYYWSVDNVKIWDPQNNDVGIQAVVYPTDGFDLSPAETIVARVRNYGLQSQNNIPVSYQLNGGPVISETLDPSVSGFSALSPGGYFDFAIPSPADFSAYQTHELKVWTGLASDTDHENDTIEVQIVNQPEVVQLTFDSLLNGTFGVETDGNYYYVSFWSEPGKFGRYSMSGDFIDTFRISGLSVGIRDMAWDPTTGHFYGGASTPVLYELDLTSATPSLIGQVSTPSGASVRYVAFDHVRDGFWVGNLNGDIFLIERSGLQMTAPGITNPILSASLTGLGNRYGIAFDDWSCPGEYLWIFCQPTTPSNVYLAEVDISTGLPTGVSIDLTTQLTFSGATPAAAGLFTHPDLVSGTVSVGGLITGASTGTFPNQIFVANLESLHPDQPMVVDDVFPADGAVQVQLDHLVMMWISESFVINDTSTIIITDGVTPVVIDHAEVSGDTLRIFHDPFLGETTYTVQLLAGTLTGLCSDNTEISWSFTTGAAGLGENALEDVLLFPNPASDYTVIRSDDEAIISIFSTEGRLMKEFRKQKGDLQISTGWLDPGVYQLRFVSDRGIKTLKLMVQ